MQYEIITAGDIMDLMSQVQTYLNKGWEPVGGPFEMTHRERAKVLDKYEDMTFFSYGQAIIFKK